jgi:two-component system cell cycle response regulator DivK
MSKILLVEDDELSRDMLSRRLAKRGFEVITATTGEEGVEQAKTETPDLILMDMRLPGMSGWEATQAIREHSKETPIIGISAHALVGDCDRALEVGCNDYDVKPIDFERLTTKINALLATEDQS